jgi:hypothetical protein
VRDTRKRGILSPEEEEQEDEQEENILGGGGGRRLGPSIEEKNGEIFH